MTQELDKNGRPKLYCANCGERMNYTYTQQWFGSSGYRYWTYWCLKHEGRTFTSTAEVEVELQRLNDLGYRDRGYNHNLDRDLKVDSVSNWQGGDTEYFVGYSEPMGEPVPWQFHSQHCMMKFLQRADIIQQIVPIITANRAKPIIPAKKPRKKRESKIDLPDYNDMNERMSDMNEKMNSMQKRILGLI